MGLPSTRVSIRSSKSRRGRFSIKLCRKSEVPNMNPVELYYKGNLPWLKERTIFLSKGGSQAYGTNTPESDLDLRGVGVAPKNYYHGFANTWNEATQHEPTDLVIFEV